ncbi:MAG: LamG domain-containing protein [Thermoproteota archaeon]|nr:LamG domain-containing protein [Thermoproteota archaeon]
MLKNTRPVSLTSNSWTHVVASVDGRTLNLYKNSILVATYPFTDVYTYPTIPLPVKIAFGALQYHYWTGDISDLQIYSRALSQSEIASILNGHHISNGLIGWWLLNEGSGTSIFDSSGKANNGIIHNAIWK